LEKQTAISINDLNYTYPDGTCALKGVSLEVGDGEKVAIVGPNGAGKSTLILHLNGIISGGEGQVFIQGQEVCRKNLKVIRSKIGIVFQDPDDQLFSPTVFDDVAFGPLNMGLDEENVRERVKQALEDVRLSGFGERFAHHMSFGEKKRAALATVLSMKPDIIVLDEPSSNLDPASRRQVIELLSSLERTMLIATHDLELVLDVCTKGILLDSGKVIASGELEGLLGDEALMTGHNLEVPLSLTLGLRNEVTPRPMPHA